MRNASILCSGSQVSQFEQKGAASLCHSMIAMIAMIAMMMMMMMMILIVIMVIIRPTYTHARLGANVCVMGINKGLIIE